MRLAEIEDWRRRLGRRDRNAAPVLEVVEITGVAGLESISLAPDTGFLAVCGGTGTGKSAILQLIYAGLSSANLGDVPLAAPRFAAGKTRIRASMQQAAFDRLTAVGEVTGIEDGGFGGGSRLVGLADRTSRPAEFFSLSEIDVLMEGIAPSEFSPSDLGSANAICRKEFSRILVYEVDGPGDAIYPFFQVWEDESSYDSRSLSTGEMSALYIIWASSSSEPYSFLFVEEPEAFLPLMSHAALFGFLSKVSVERRLGLVISTHSPSIASNVERKNLVSIVRHRGQSKVLSTVESRAKALWRLGMKPTANAVLFVEDDLAKSILNEIKGLYEFDVVCNIEIVDVRGGAGNIKNAIQNLPDGIRSVKMLGVLDGDM